MRDAGKRRVIYRESINYRRWLVNTRKCQLRFPPIGNDRIMAPTRSGVLPKQQEGVDVPGETGTPT